MGPNQKGFFPKKVNIRGPQPGFKEVVRGVQKRGIAWGDVGGVSRKTPVGEGGAKRGKQMENFKKLKKFKFFLFRGRNKTRFFFFPKNTPPNQENFLELKPQRFFLKI